jgi:nicotinate-nucleotide adenylyltransferase
MVPTHLLLNDPSIEQILIVPCYQQTGKKLTAFWPRYKMCRMAFEWLPRVKVSNVEQVLGGESMTVRTLQHLKKEHPTWKLRFVMGSDLIEKAPSWQGWEEIQKIAPPLIVGRAGITPPPGVEGPTPISPLVSSTIVRKAVESKDYEAARRYLPKDVLEYIKEFKLYTPEALFA